MVGKKERKGKDDEKEKEESWRRRRGGTANDTKREYRFEKVAVKVEAEHRLH